MSMHWDDKAPITALRPEINAASEQLRLTVKESENFFDILVDFSEIPLDIFVNYGIYMLCTVFPPPAPVQTVSNTIPCVPCGAGLLRCF